MSRLWRAEVAQIPDGKEFMEALQAMEAIAIRRQPVVELTGRFEHFASPEQLEAHLKYVKDNEDTLEF